jgi:hypothetical protein
VDYLWNCCDFLSARWVSARCEGDKPTGLMQKGLYALRIPARRPLRPRSDRSGPPLGRYAAAGILPARYTPLRFAAAVDAAVVPGCVLGRALSNDRLARARRCAAASHGDKAEPGSLEGHLLDCDVNLYTSSNFLGTTTCSRNKVKTRLSNVAERKHPSSMNSNSTQRSNLSGCRRHNLRNYVTSACHCPNVLRIGQLQGIISCLQRIQTNRTRRVPIQNTPGGNQNNKAD